MRTADEHRVGVRVGRHGTRVRLSCGCGWELRSQWREREARAAYASALLHAGCVADADGSLRALGERLADLWPEVDGRKGAQRRRTGHDGKRADQDLAGAERMT